MRRIVGLLVVVSVGVFVAQPALGQPGGRGGFGGRFGGVFDNSLMLLTRDEVRNELGLVDEQIEQLESLQAESREMMRDMFQRGRGDGETDWQAIQENFRSKLKEFEDKIRNDVLTPMQTERLEQIGLQSRQQRGAVGALESIQEKLGITDQQMQELRDEAEKAQQEFQKKIEAARREMQEQILGVLTADQRKQYQELVGDPFELDNTRQRRQRGGDRRRGADRGDSDGERGDRASRRDR